MKKWPIVGTDLRNPLTGMSEQTEAENCIGEDVSYVGETKVEVDVDPSIPDVPTEPAPVPPMDVTRAPEATPFV